MGLDLVEFVIRLEKDFNINIPDTEAQQLTTPGKVITYLSHRLGVVPEPRCETQSTFYKLRNVLHQETGIDRKHIYPSRPVDSVLPNDRRKRRFLWKRLQYKMTSSLFPDLSRPRWVTTIIYGFAASIGIITAYYLLPSGLSAGFSISCSLTAAALTLLLCMYATTEWKTEIPPWYTLGDLTHLSVVTVGQQTSPEPSRTWTREQIASHVRAVIVEKFGVTTFSDDSLFLEDLGID